MMFPWGSAKTIGYQPGEAQVERQSPPRYPYFTSMCHPANAPVAPPDRFAVHDGGDANSLDSPKSLSWWPWGNDQTAAKVQVGSLCIRIHVNTKYQVRTRNLLVIETCAFSSVFFSLAERNRIC